MDTCEATDVGRTTFYAHVPSKDDLKRSGLDHLRKVLMDRQRVALIEAGDDGRQSLAFSLPMFEHARDHIHLHRALIGSRGGVIAQVTIRESIADLLRDEVTENAVMAKGAMPCEIAVQYMVGACMALLGWRLDGGERVPASQVVAAFRQQATNGIASAAGSLRVMN